MNPLAGLHLGCRVLWLTLCGRFVESDHVRDDYNRLGASYDEYFGDHVRKHSQVLLNRLPLHPGMHVLDLAAGTGTLTLPLARTVGCRGRVVSVDRSLGMQAVCRGKCRAEGLEHVTFIEDDLLRTLRSQPDDRFDAVTCGWAIGYVDPVAALKEARRVLKPGGIVGIIENRKHTLWPIRQTAIRVARALPGRLSCLMNLHERLPRNARQLQSWFGRAGLRPVATWGGHEPFRFRSGADVLDWVLHTGASAGFDRMMAAEAKEECDALFIRFMEDDYMQGGHIEVAHCYVAGIATKGGTPCT